MHNEACHIKTLKKTISQLHLKLWTLNLALVLLLQLLLCLTPWSSALDTLELRLGPPLDQIF